MKIKILAIVAALLAGAGLSRADITGIDLWSDNTDVMTCSYGSLTGGSGNYQLGIDGAQLEWAMGSIGGTITTDGAGTDPTLQLGEVINNDTEDAWYDYHVTIKMSQPFSFSNVGVDNYEWTFNTTAPVFNGSDWIGYIDYYAGTPVQPDNSILDFSFAVSFSGSPSFEEDLMPSTVPEPTTTGCFLLGLGALICCQRFTKNRRS